MMYTERSLSQLLHCDSRKYDTVKNVRKAYLEEGAQATYLVNDKRMYRHFIKDDENEEKPAGDSGGGHCWDKLQKLYIFKISIKMVIFKIDYKFTLFILYNIIFR